MKPDVRLVLLALSLALVACSSEQKPAQKNTAGGEILEGSASDAMLPLDTVRSQPPLAPPPQASGKAAVKDGEEVTDDASDAPGEATGAVSAAPSPAASAAGQ